MRHSPAERLDLAQGELVLSELQRMQPGIQALETALEGPLRPLSLTFRLVEKETEAESKTKQSCPGLVQASFWEPGLVPCLISNQLPGLGQNIEHYS